jgi:hypothetical protein
LIEGIVVSLGSGLSAAVVDGYRRPSNIMTRVNTMLAMMDEASGK